MQIEIIGVQKAKSISFFLTLQELQTNRNKKKKEVEAEGHNSGYPQ